MINIIVFLNLIILSLNTYPTIDSNLVEGLSVLNFIFIVVFLLDDLIMYGSGRGSARNLELLF